MAHTADDEWARKIKSQLLGKKFLHIYHIVGRIILIATLAVQFAFLDYYLIHFNSLLWLLWIIADLVIVVLFLFTVILSYRHLEMRLTRPHPIQRFGELPLTYVSWFVYSVILSAKVWCLHALPDSIVLQLNDEYFFGRTLLRTTISLASMVMYVLVLTSHDSRSHSEQNAFIQSIVGCVYLDLLDTSEFLGTMRDESLVIRQYHLDHAILAVACFNFVLPTEGLYMLARKHFGKSPVSVKYGKLYSPFCSGYVVDGIISDVRPWPWPCGCGLGLGLDHILVIVELPRTVAYVMVVK